MSISLPFTDSPPLPLYFIIKKYFPNQQKRPPTSFDRIVSIAFLFHFLFVFSSVRRSGRFHLDRDDKGPESEEEIWADDGIQRGPASSKPPAAKAVTAVQKRPEGKRTANDDQQAITKTVNNDEDTEDYGGSTDVDDPDTDDEIEL